MTAIHAPRSPDATGAARPRAAGTRRPRRALLGLLAGALAWAAGPVAAPPGAHARTAEPASAAGAAVVVRSQPCTSGPHAPGSGQGRGHGQGRSEGRSEGRGEGQGHGHGQGHGRGGAGGHGAAHGGHGDGHRGGQGLSGDEHAALQRLVSSRDRIRRVVTQLADRVVTETTSDDPALVPVLREHVAAMHRRLAGGRGVRGWDPLFVELRRVWPDVEVAVEESPGGIRVETRWRSEAARVAALAHAEVVSRFLARGPDEVRSCHVVVEGTHERGREDAGGGPVEDAASDELAPAPGAANRPAAAASAPGPPPDPAAWARARADAEIALDAMLGGLKARLGEAIRTDGPGAAIAVCSHEAPAIRDAVLAAAPLGGTGARLGRSGTRLRDPANRGPGWVEAWLAGNAGRPASEARAFTAVAGGPQGPVLRSLRPLGVQGVCLLCHGPREGLPPEVSDALAERYPEDRATGYAVGDLRGAAWVEVPLGR